MNKPPADEPNSLSFKPRARLIRTIGDRLISGPEAAIIELVKNAHDADATFIKIIFHPPLNKNDGRIEIEDDGHGMTIADIEAKWMEPATTDKVDRDTSPGGRKLLGSKGIGRFATARLGRYLEMTSTAEAPDTKSLETYRVFGVDWDFFDKATYLSEVKFNYETLQPKERTGTQMTITHLRNTWAKKSQEDLLRELRRLVSPIEEKEESDFRIYLDLSNITVDNCGFDGAEIVNGILPDKTKDDEKHLIRPYPLLKACDYEVEGSFDSEGNFNGSMKINRANQDPEEFSLEIPIKPDFNEAPCGDLLVHLFIFDREGDAIQETIKKAGLGDVTKREARKLLDDIAGVAIYRDKFRIRPYGDNSQDWLTLDKLRVQKPTLKIGHNQIAGLILIDNEDNSGLIERSSREGLEDNDNYRRLVRLILTLLSSYVEPARYEFRKKSGISRPKTDSFTDARESAKLEWIEAFTSKLSGKEQEKAKRKVARETGKLIKQLDALEEKQAILQAKVTLGLILGEVLHEGRTPVSFIQTETRRLSKWLPTLCDDMKSADYKREEIPSILNGLDSSADRLRILFKMLDPISGRRRGRPSEFDVKKQVELVFHFFSDTIKKLDVKTTVLAESDLPRAYGHRDDLVTALTNLVDNSLFWFDHHNVEDPELHVHIYTEKNDLVLDVQDNGHGIPEKFADSLFDVGFSLKTNGTGLGLSIAREAIGRSSGTIMLASNSPGAVFRIKIPLQEAH